MTPSQPDPLPEQTHDPDNPDHYGMLPEVPESAYADDATPIPPPDDTDQDADALPAEDAALVGSGEPQPNPYTETDVTQEDYS